MYFKTQAIETLTPFYEGKTPEELNTRRSLPFDLFEDTEHTPLEELFKSALAINLDQPIDDDVKAHIQHAIAVALTKAGVSRLSECPNIQKIEYKEEKSSVLPKEVTSIPSLRVLELNYNRKFKALHKNLKLAENLLALNLRLLHNIRDISAITALQNLTYLEFYNTIKLEDYDPILELKKLDHLNVDTIDLNLVAPTFTKLHPIKTLELRSSCFMDYHQPVLYDIIDAHKDSLLGLGLQSSNLFHKPLPHLPRLEELDLYSIQQLHPGTFDNTPSLQALNLHHFKEDTLPSSLDTLTTLELLDLSFASALTTDGIKVLGSLENLKYLNLTNTPLTEFPVEFGALKNLNALSLNSAKIQDISVLKSLTSLKYLDLNSFKDQKQLEDVVLNLLNLEEVVVHTDIDIKPLANAPALKRVSRIYNKYKQEDVGPDFTAYQSTAFRNT